jgi:hypothetical protein
LALRGCNKSLKSLTLARNEIGDEHNRIDGEPLEGIMEALSTHTQLQDLYLERMNIGANECTAVVNLLRSTTTELRTLNLYINNIDDVGVDALVDALLANSNLGFLDLSRNQITVRGCQRLAALLENPNSNLESLDIATNNIGNEGAQMVANALATNRKLKTLYLHSNGITAEGWSSFSKVLCDTSSVNNTHLSNHTLESLGYMPSNIPADVKTLLALNASSDNNKRQVAIKKIFIHHNHFDMHPFFKLELKVLPLVVDLFERARSVETIDEAGIEKRKLDAIYQFVQGVPVIPEQLQRHEKMKRNAVGAFQLFCEQRCLWHSAEFQEHTFYFTLWAAVPLHTTLWLF